MALAKLKYAPRKSNPWADGSGYDAHKSHQLGVEWVLEPALDELVTFSDASRDCARTAE